MRRILMLQRTACPHKNDLTPCNGLGQGPNNGSSIQAAQAGSTYAQRARAPQLQRVSVDHLADLYEMSQSLGHPQVSTCLIRNCKFYGALLEGNAAGYIGTLYKHVADRSYYVVQDDSVQLGQALPMVAPVGF